MDTRAQELAGHIIPLTENESHLSRTIYEHTDSGEVIAHRLSVVSLKEGQIIITPFESETPCTIYHDRPLHVYPDLATIRLHP